MPAVKPAQGGFFRCLVKRIEMALHPNIMQVAGILEGKIIAKHMGQHRCRCCTYGMSALLYIPEKGAFAAREASYGPFFH